MAEAKPAMRKPVFTKVDQLRPGTSGHTLTVKVVSSKMVMQKGRPDGPQVRQTRIAECMIGDETGIIVFTARNEQVDLMKPNTIVILRNAKIDMFKGSMRLAVDKWGRIEVTTKLNRPILLSKKITIYRLSSMSWLMLLKSDARELVYVPMGVDRLRKGFY